MSEFSIEAVESPSLTGAEARRWRGRAYALILSWGAQREPVNPSGTAEVSDSSTVGDTLAVEPENQ